MKVDHRTMIEMIDPVIIVSHNGNPERKLISPDKFKKNWDYFEIVPHLSLYEIWKQTMRMLALDESEQAVCIDVWEESDLSGRIYRYRGEQYSWYLQGETRGYA
ncbi:hypothetical protein PPK13_gp44 [Bacillus phage Ray17]|uniref:Uncharacterized protein n=1 Tax=Bacillus phage Ray17 TaxID=2315627 RepID=A0A386K9K5_9CAUD|nr:hypothetical protein PPK13_gp44 [Bacillus phage Ray17]AYD80946.1 hypothetical protein Ray17_45 [Bacillus phage Ray17]